MTDQDNKRSTIPMAERALKHGAGAGENAITAGDSFTGMAAEQEQRVLDELEVKGISSIVRRDAIRLQTVADLYYAAILGADSIEKFDTYVKRYGWICGSALRAWQHVREIEKQETQRDVHDVLAAIRGEDEGQSGE